jgi:hypothetical protein
MGMRDNRGAIGYHRGGELSDIMTLEKIGRIVREDFPIFLDRYEPVILHAEDQNHYRLTSDGNAIAHELQNPDAEEGEEAMHAAEFTYSDNELATFVIDQPLDGAGTMVVNGNLHIKDTFAYYGILMVTGDLIIEPTLKKNQFVWSKEGWPMDYYGNHPVFPSTVPPEHNHSSHDPLSKDPCGMDEFYNADYDPEEEDLDKQSWYYLPDIKNLNGKNLNEIQESEKSYIELDPNGEPLWNAGKLDQGTYLEVPVRPKRVDEYRGELIIQGKLLVKGRIITKSVPEMTQEPELDPEGMPVLDTDGNPVMVEVPTGKEVTGGLNAYWSKKAVDAMAGMFPLGEPGVRRVSWVHNDSIDVDSVWQNTQDTPEK